MTSALTFAVGAALPIAAVLIAPQRFLVAAVSASSLIFLAALGALGAWIGGAGMIKPALRVGFWGAFAMAVTAGVGALIGKAI